MQVGKWNCKQSSSNYLLHAKAFNNITNHNGHQNLSFSFCTQSSFFFRVSLLWKSFVNLILKKGDVFERDHCKLINLCKTLYKVCIRIIVDRMQSILSRLISLVQENFVRDRNIPNDILIVWSFLSA